MMNAHLASAEFRDLVRKDQRETAFKQMREAGIGEWKVAETSQLDVKRYLDKIAKDRPGSSRAWQTAFSRGLEAGFE
jgi:hypothetical protein